MPRRKGRTVAIQAAARAKRRQRHAVDAQKRAHVLLKRSRERLVRSSLLHEHGGEPEEAGQEDALAGVPAR